MGYNFGTHSCLYKWKATCTVLFLYLMSQILSKIYSAKAKQNFEFIRYFWCTYVYTDIFINTFAGTIIISILCYLSFMHWVYDNSQLLYIQMLGGISFFRNLIHNMIFSYCFKYSIYTFDIRISLLYSSIYTWCNCEKLFKKYAHVHKISFWN